jgi:eukaryotic-like serine/threonine-protein kinase
MEGERIASRYRLVERLGAGAMADVWRAEDEELDRTVAVKLLRPDADRARFDREAHAAAALTHPNVNQLFDYGEAEGRPFMVLEYLPGGSLDDRLRPGEPLPDAEAEAVATDIASGLAHAHAQELVHRDLKPANVLFDAEGRAKIADFGIARLAAAATLTETGTVLGTAAFISPEQATGGQATPASDVYSFGAILFRLLTGRLPFEADEPMVLATMHVTQAPPRVADVRPPAPEALAALTERCLAKRPEDRPRDGTALLRELTAAMPAAALAAAAEPAQVADAATTRVLPSLPAAPAEPPPRPPTRTRPLLAVVGALVLLAAGVGAAVILGGRGSSPEPTAPARQLPSVARRVTSSTSARQTSNAQSTTAEEATTRERTQPRTTAPSTETAPPTATGATTVEPTVPPTATTAVTTTATEVPPPSPVPGG